MTQTPLARSRLIKKQEAKLAKQLLWSVGLGLILILLFLFFILPNSARVLTFLIDTTPPPNDSIIIQAPVFDAPPTITNQAQLELTGFALANGELELEVNNQVQPSVRVDEEGRFLISVQLNEGENQISAFVKTNQAERSARSKIMTIILDKQPPSLTLNNIEPQMTVVGRDHSLFRLTGQSEPEVKLSFNGRSIFARPDGSFSYDYQLLEGENLIKIEAQDQAGNLSQTEVLVTYRL